MESLPPRRFSSLGKSILTRPKTNRVAFYSFLAKRAVKGAIVSHVTKDVVVEYKGTRFLFAANLPFETLSYSLYMEESEPRTYEYMTSQGGGIFVDVGANIGGYSIRLARRFEKVISVEPNPRVAELLRKNVQLNGLGNIEIVQGAASDLDGEAILSVPPGRDALSSIVREFPGGEHFKVNTMTLDGLLDKYDKIDLIKIDVEGAELKALKGAAKSLEKTSRVVVEVGAEDCLRILQDSGLELSDLDLKTCEEKVVGKNVLGARRT